MSNCADHGNAFRADGETMDYGTPPKFTMQEFDHVGRLADEMKREAASATIHLQRLKSKMDMAHAAEALRDKEVGAAIDNCKTALDAAIAYLTRHERKAA